MANPPPLIKFLLPPERPPQPVYCSAEGCSKPTHDGKPKCLEHVLDMPYVQEVLDGLSNGASLGEEILSMLIDWPALSAPVAARLLEIPLNEAEAKFQELAEKGELTLTKNQKGTTIAQAPLPRRVA